MWIANLSAGIMILIIGILMRVFKLSFFIAGYNTMSKEEKARYYEDKLVRSVSNLLFVLAALLLVGYLFSIFTGISDTVLIISSWASFLLAIIIGLIYINTNKRFRNN